MGGIGSGNHWRWDAKNTTADYLSIDVRRWHRDGCLRSGQNFSWAWTRDGEAAGSVNVRTEPGRVVLNYRHRINGGEWESKEYPVRLDWTPCNYGGQRPWFLCPVAGCRRRVAILYGGGVFACRHCHQLAYPSQNESWQERASRRSRKIIQRLGGDPYGDFYPSKPKFMHRRTYLRLINMAEYYEEISMLAALNFFTRRL